jgi:CYTH domain-containing protein
MSGEARRHGRFELARRFLVERLPNGIDPDHGWRITDRYINGTRLRLRRAEHLSGNETLFKLGQKIVPLPPNYSRTTITNIYLSADEYVAFNGLPARELRKCRYSTSYGGRSVAVDVFGAQLTGLILAEIVFETSDEMKASGSVPPWVEREVSCQIQFTGGALATLTPQEATNLVHQLSSGCSANRDVGRGAPYRHRRRGIS